MTSSLSTFRSFVGRDFKILVQLLPSLLQRARHENSNFFADLNSFNAAFQCFDKLASLSSLFYMERVDNFGQFKILLNSIVSETITAMDNLQHTIIVPNNTRRTRTGTTALEKIKFSSLCNRLKAHLVHIPQDIDQFDGGPHTESETCEQQHKFMRELLYHTNRQNGGRDIAVRFAEEYMLRHIGEGGYFPNPSTSALEMCGASVQAAFDNTLIQSELELLDNNSSRKKLAGLFKSDSSSKPSKLVLGVIVQKINDNFVVEAYDFIPINNNPVSIYDSCQTDIAGNFIICRFPSDDFITHNSSTVTNPIEVIFDMAHPPILLDSRSTDLLCVNKSKFGTLWWLRNTTCDFEKIVAHQEINV